MHHHCCGVGSRGLVVPVLARMVANVAIEVVVGAMPILGDMFDIAWRANRRNYALLVGSMYEPRKHTRQSWFFLGGLCVYSDGTGDCCRCFCWPGCLMGSSMRCSARDRMVCSAQSEDCCEAMR